MCCSYLSVSIHVDKQDRVHITCVFKELVKTSTTLTGKLMSLLTRIFVLSVLFFVVEAKVFSVSDYGAYPNDNIEDSDGIQMAVNSAISDGFSSTISFGTGTYSLSSTINITNVTNLTITGQGTDQTFLIGTVPMTMFIAQFGQGLTIRSLSIDFDPLPFTGGYVVNVSDAFIDIQIQPPHQIDVAYQVGSLLRYDPVEMRPAFGPNTYVYYPSVPMNSSAISTDILRVTLTSASQFNVGDAVLARYANRYRAIYASTLTDLTIQSLNIYASWFMGLVTNRITRFNVIDVQIAPKDGRWLSTVLDCMNFANSREYINIVNSSCVATGDDGLNVHEPYLFISAIINSTTVMTQVLNNTDAYINAGDRVEFSSQTKPFTVYQTATVASFRGTGPFSRLLTLTTAINASVGDYVGNADSASLTIRNFTVKNNRAHGVLLETRNVDIRDSVFNRTSAPAVLFQPSLYWNEGPTARNVTLINNLYINCNEGIGQDHGMISITLHPTQLEPVMQDIRIESSTFYFGNYSRGFLLSRNANNVYIGGNYLATNNSDPYIIICNSRNITASNNTLINQKFQTDKYYAFDTLKPCEMNLSSLIDLPPSAFNSSFPPPVVIS